MLDFDLICRCSILVFHNNDARVLFFFLLRLFFLYLICGVRCCCACWLLLCLIFALVSSHVITTMFCWNNSKPICKPWMLSKYTNWTETTNIFQRIKWTNKIKIVWFDSSTEEKKRKKFKQSIDRTIFFCLFISYKLKRASSSEIFGMQASGNLSFCDGSDYKINILISYFLYYYRAL